MVELGAGAIGRPHLYLRRRMHLKLRTLEAMELAVEEGITATTKEDKITGTLAGCSSRRMRLRRKPETES